MTLDEVVSYNLRKARELRGWTQLEAADRISTHLGRVWSQQVYGDAERAHRSERVKVFNGDEVLALALAFDLPIPWFYLPPTLDSQIIARGSDQGISGEELVWIVFPGPSGDDSRSARADALRNRIGELALTWSFGDGEVPMYPGGDALKRLVAEQVKIQLEANEAFQALLKAPEDSEESQRAGERLADVLRRREEPDDGEGTDQKDPA